jgi:hypothetical protein
MNYINFIKKFIYFTDIFCYKTDNLTEIKTVIYKTWKNWH